MARPGITYYELSQVAAKLAASGKNPTVDTVREALGGTGSKSTIAPLLKRWKAEHQEQVASASVDLPPVLVQGLRQVYEQIQAQAALALDQAELAHTATLGKIQVQWQTLVTEHSALKLAYQGHEQTLCTTQARLSEREAQCHAQEVALATSNADKAGLEQRTTLLTDQLRAAREQFEHFQNAVAEQRHEERQRHEQVEARSQQALSEGRQQLLSLQAVLSEATTRLNYIAAENDRLQASVTHIQDALQSLRVQHERVTLQASDATQRAHQLEDNNRCIQQELSAVKTALAVTDIEGARQKERADQLANQLAGMALDKQLLGDEKAALNEQLRHLQQCLTTTLSPTD